MRAKLSRSCEGLTRIARVRGPDREVADFLDRALWHANFGTLDLDLHRGKRIDEVFDSEHLVELGQRVRALGAESGGSFEEIDLSVGAGHRVRVSSQALQNDQGNAIGRVILFMEISHEPLTREFEKIVEIEELDGFRHWPRRSSSGWLPRSVPLRGSVTR